MTQSSQYQGVQGDTKGFFGALFDTNFENFITIKFAKFIYIFVMVLGAAAWVIWLLLALYSFTEDAGTGFLALLAVIVLGIPLLLFYVVMVRLQIEFIVAAVRTAQNISSLVKLQGGNEHAAAGQPVNPTSHSTSHGYPSQGYGAQTSFGSASSEAASGPASGSNYGGYGSGTNPGQQGQYRPSDQQGPTGKHGKDGQDDQNPFNPFN